MVEKLFSDNSYPMFIEIALGVVLGGVILYLLHFLWEEKEAIGDIIGRIILVLLFYGGGVGLISMVSPEWNWYGIGEPELMIIWTVVGITLLGGVLFGRE